MYSVSNDFLAAVKQPVQEHRITGSIGIVSFGDANIVGGSFHIQNQCTDTSDVVLGSVYTGVLTAVFHGINISRYSWVGKTINAYFGLKISANAWEDIPLGIFTIKEAKHTSEGVEVTAYDNMIKLDKKFKASKFKTAKKMYQHLTTICTACGLTLGMTEEEIQALPNGNTNLGIVGTKSNKYLNYKKYGNDIDTYRDLVYWIAQSMGTFATINRDGELVLRKYKKPSTAVDEITESYRLEGAVFDDFTTNYTGIYVTNTKDGEEIYYGYDVTELNQEISDTESALSSLEQQIMELWTQYQQGEITEEQYKAAVKPLNKQVKNLEKRLDWLNVALEKAQNEEDGLFMDLGENPILQPDGVGSTYDAMRKRVLKALDAISYTPFTCSTVVGVHYDLGDVIQFTGGHATEIGEACCMMAYDFNLNGEFQMQGFGSDPSKPVIKNKNSKKADKADKNGVNSTNVSTGTSLPDGGNKGDLFIQTGATDISDLEYDGERYDWDNISVEDVDDITFNLKMGGVSTADLTAERVTYTIDGFTVGKEYNCSFTGQFSSGTTFFNLWGNDVDLHDIPYEQTSSQSRQRVANLVSDLNSHDYSGNFTATASTMYISFTFSDTTDGHYDEFYVNNLKFTPSSNAVESMSVYDNDRWNNIDYVKKVTQTQTSGTEIAEVQNSDGTTTKIYQRDGGLVDDVKVDGTSVVTNKIANINTMTGAGASAAGAKGLVPAPASGDNNKFLRGDGTWVGAIPTSQKGAANGVAELGNDGKVPSAQLPSYVDDVLEYASLSAFPATGETGKIYVALDTNKTYRWSGSAYVEISPSLALGTTSSTAYYGDKGKTAYDHSQSDHSTIAPAFTEAGTRANIATGESLATMFGKIKKFFSDLKTVAFTGAYSDLSGTPTIPDVSTKYDSTDTAETTLSDDDKLPFYDTSATAKRNSTWANIKAKLNGCETKTDTTPYLYRQSEANGDRVYEEYVGGSVGWNQLVENGNFASSSGWSTITSSLSVSNNIGTFTASAQNGGIYRPFNVIANHKYLMLAKIKLTTASDKILFTTYKPSSPYDSKDIYTQSNTNWQTLSSIVNKSYSTSYYVKIYDTRTSGWDAINVKNVQCIDLTLLFGTTIADYAYTLESQTAGSGIQWLKDNGYDFSDYSAYNAVELVSVKLGSKKYVGFNQWDEEVELGILNTSTGAEQSSTTRLRSKNYIKVLADTEYYFKGTFAGGVLYYDENKNFISTSYPENTTRTIPNNARYIRFSLGTDYGTTYNHDICINISKPTGTPKNGDYVPYDEHTYPLGSDTLRGILDLENGKIVYKGDVKTSDGKVQRKYLEPINLGSLDWTYQTEFHRFYSTIINDLKAAVSDDIATNGICSKYTWNSVNNRTDKHVGTSESKRIFVYDTAYTDAATFKTAMNGVYLIAESATPTTETSTPFLNPQICDKDGTEEFINNETIKIPVGHNSTYVKVPDWMEEYYPKDFRDRVDGFNVDYYQQVVKQERVELESGEYAYFYLFANGLKVCQMGSTMGNGAHQYNGVIPQAYRPKLLTVPLAGSSIDGKARMCILQSNGNMTIGASDMMGMILGAVYM